MIKILRSALLLVFACFVGLGIAFAQTTPQANTSSLAHKAELFFNSAIKQQSLLNNGVAFQDYASNVDGSANFQDLTTFVNGSVVYQGFRFDNVPLMYNLHQDRLISSLGRFSKYSFVSDKVSDFYLNNHHFKYIKVSDTTQSIIKSGFYDLIHDGESKIYVRRVRNMQYTLENKVVRYFFVPKTNYYIERDQKFSSISGEGSFMSYFKDKKSELKKLLKEKNIKFRKKPEVAMQLLASYYEGLKN